MEHPVPIEPELGDLPLVDYLAVLWPDRSKDGIKALFAKGAVRSGGRPVSPVARAGDHDALTLHADPGDLPAIHLAPEELDCGVRLLHEDRRIAVVDKPSGVPVVPDRDRRSPSCLGFLISREIQARGRKAPAEYIRPRVVHRIDRLTSGVVVLARSLEAEVRLSRMFEGGEVRKEYLAILLGEVGPARIAVNIPISAGRKGKMRAAAEGKPSLTEYEVVERLRGFTLVRAFPRTGRTHQIRVHAWSIGHPLAVDPLYRVGAFAAPQVQAGAEIAGRPGAPPVIRRLTLHAERIILPESWGEPREFRSELPADFLEALSLLRGERRLET